MTEKQKKQIHPLSIIIFSLLALYLLTMVVSLFWTLMTTVKSTVEYNYYDDGSGRLGNILWLPKEGITLKNYIMAYKHFYVEIDVNGLYTVRFNIFQQFINSVLYSVGCATAVTVTSLVMGYATARFKYKFSEFIYTFVLLTVQ